MESTSEPWITTPAFKTWSRISRRETSSPEIPTGATDSKSFCIGDKRIRRPGAIYFDAAGAAPFLHKTLQRRVPLLAPGTRNQKCGLPEQVGLYTADLAAGRRVQGNFLQFRRKFTHAGIVVLRPSRHPSCFVLEIFLARAYFRRRFRGRGLLSKDLHAPLIGTGNPLEDLVQR